jgi:ribosomal protein S6--L-glutamate ligase
VPIEINRTDRTKMAYRMLNGRQAIQPDWQISPAGSLCQERLSHDIHHSAEVKARRPCPQPAHRGPEPVGHPFHKGGW